MAFFIFKVDGLAKLLVIDNYDSFTYNLVQMFLGYKKLNIKVFRSDKITVGSAEKINPDYILISPGPKDPEHAGVSVPVIKAFYKKVPVLGVCLGMQCINEVFSGKTVNSACPTHGKTSKVYHKGEYIFSGMSAPFTAARYHSLEVFPNSSELVVTAKTCDKIIMGISHKTLPVHGVQFHPESFLTENGAKIIDNFLKTGCLNES